ncbi:DUF397 domain-containing protein [Streptomyces sp. MZ04]|uniref:DUF397 domain-containing protein n=1 Tax=Streptomyces sp. MZ04 TaxID=2559236 RepID=UPI00107E6D0E|nr:DUF397 domain-containing protein [Streptomyces sp. MZ04]TGA84456.1 DUF397 domain-containing protein [Streptomyces sp. MZ04]
MIQWQKSSFSSGSDGASCVELASHDDKLLLRESDDPTQVLALTRSGLAALLQQIRTARP